MTKKQNIFEERDNFMPYEYPELIKYADAINKSYWLVSEYNFTPDIQDFKTKLTEEERGVIKRAMLAIAQIEVSVKAYWSKLYDRLPKPEVAIVGMSFADCHVDGTEVLTPNGWVDFKDISVGDKVMQYEKDGSFSITNVQHKTDDYYTGDIINFPKLKREIGITPNHRVIYKTKSGNLLEKKAGDLKGLNSDMKIPQSGKFSNIGINNLTPLERLKIAIQADGSARYYMKDGVKTRRGLSSNSHTYEISVKKDRKKHRLYNLLENSNVTYREFETNRDGYIKIEVDLDQDFDYKTFDWVDISNKSHEWCHQFIGEVLKWDGVILNKTHQVGSYTSTDKNCIDKVQLIAICAGFYTTINKFVDEREDHYKDVYTLSFMWGKDFTGTNSKKEISHYEGRVRCITVPSGMIITRYKDTTFISGNSEVRHSRAYAELLRVLGLQEEFESIMDVPEIKGRVNYLKKYLKGTRARDNRVYTKSIILFSSFIEHVSLFSQFLIIMSFNKDKNVLSGMSNVVEATSLEEEVHGDFGAYIVNIIRQENPEWFDQEMSDMIESACRKSFIAESALIDWIYGDTDLDFLPKNVVKEFVKNRFNMVLSNGGFNPIFEVNEELLEDTEWFEVQLKSSKEDDFFYKTPVSYSKNTKSITEDDLF